MQREGLGLGLGLGVEESGSNACPVKEGRFQGVQASG